MYSVGMARSPRIERADSTPAGLPASPAPSARVKRDTTLAYCAFPSSTRVPHAPAFHLRPRRVPAADRRPRRRPALVRPARAGGRDAPRSRPQARFSAPAARRRRHADAALEESFGHATGAGHQRPEDRLGRGGGRRWQDPHAALRTRAARQATGQQAHDRNAEPSARGADRLHDLARRQRPAMARACADRGRHAAFHVLAVRIDPRALVGAAAGFARDPLHLARARHRAAEREGGDERAQRSEASAGRFVRLHPGASGALVPAGDRRGRPAGARNRAAFGGVRGTFGGGQVRHEFSDTEKMIETAESLYGSYRWGRYDILVLPPSFPFGGMENPNMTFATPTIIVCDKSLVSVISHELAHSWSGNLVTAASWRDIWLNEGITTYVQGRITEALYGRRQATEETLLAIRNLQKTIGAMPENSQRLAPEPRKVDADDELSDVAYDKGSWFLRTLEQRFGRRAFDAYLKGYFDHFAWRSITTEQMLAYLEPNLIDKYPGRMSRDEVKEWVYGAGIPKDAPIPDSPRFDAIDKE